MPNLHLLPGPINPVGNNNGSTNPNNNNAESINEYEQLGNSVKQKMDQIPSQNIKILTSPKLRLLPIMVL